MTNHPKVLKCRKILQSSRTENALITGQYEKSFSAAPSIRPKLLEQRLPLQVSFFHDNKKVIMQLFPENKTQRLQQDF